MFRILTEDVNRESIYAILDSHVGGYTVTPSIGSWKGQRENSLAVDLVDVDRLTVARIAESIRLANRQESVLILDFPAKATFVSPKEWSGSPDPSDPDNFWIDDDTGERVNAVTGERTVPQIDGTHLTHRGSPK
jgi:hypothetical protein